MACNITGTVATPDGSSAANRQITLRKEDFTLSASGTLSVLPEEIVVYTDDSGNVDFDLVAGTYSGYYVSSPDGRAPFRLRVPSDTPTANFADLIVVTSVTDDPALTQLVLEAKEIIESGGGSGGGPATWGNITGTLSAQTDLQAALDTKATTASVALKADTTTVNSALALKANITDVTAGLALKADTAALTSGLALKADTTTVNAALTLKANVTDVTAGLATKSDVGHTHTFSTITDKPTTVAGYGLTDAARLVDIPGENFIRNPRFRSWVDTDVTTSSASDVATALNWVVRVSSGSLTATRIYDGFGLSGDPAIRVSNIGTPGTFQSLAQGLDDWQSLCGSLLRLSFDARASLTGQVWNNINLSLFYDGSSVYRKAVDGSATPLTTEWTRKSFTIPALNLTEAQITAINSASSVKMRLEFQINAGSPDRELWFDLKNVKLERGNVETPIQPLQRSSALWSDIADTPTTLEGYGITDRPVFALRPPVGDYIMTTNGASGGTLSVTAAAVAGRIQLYPFVAPFDINMTSVVINVGGTPVEGALARVIVYGTDTNGRPSDLLGQTPDIDASSGGAKSAAMALVLPRGQAFFLGIHSSAASVYSSWSSSAIPDISGGSSVTTQMRKTLRRTVDFVSGAPSTWGWSSSEISFGAAPAIWLVE